MIPVNLDPSELFRGYVSAAQLRGFSTQKVELQVVVDEIFAHGKRFLR